MSRATLAPISPRIAAIAESATLKVDAKAKALKAAGRPIVSYAAGEPDFDSPAHVVEAAERAARDPRNHHYTAAAGLPELREAIAAKTLRDSGLEVAPSAVIVTNGGKQAVYQSIQTLVGEGDEVIIPSPYWVTYPEVVKLAGGTPVAVFAGADQDYRVTVEQLEAARTPAHQGAAVRLTVEPDRIRLLPRGDPRHRRVGARARRLGRDGRDLPEPRLRRGARGLDRRGGAGARRADRARQRRREDVRDDRMAGRLDGRPRRRRSRAPATCSRTCRRT